MKHSLRLLGTITLAFIATAQSQATPFSYTYSWTASPIAIAAGTGGVTLTNEQPVTTSQETDTAATNITVFSAAPDSNADVIPTPAGGSNYSLIFTLSDSQGDSPGTVAFTGLLLGTLTHDSSNLNNAITGATDGTGTHAGQTFGEVTLGIARYVVSYSGFAAPGPEAQHNQGAISFHISFAPAQVDHPTTPEPSSLLLGCLGLTVFGMVYRTRRRKASFDNVAL